SAVTDTVRGLLSRSQMRRQEEDHMRKLVASMYSTLDGVTDSMEKWHFEAWNDEMGAFAHEQLFAADALLMGRVSYDGFAPVWPTVTDEVGFADRMNSLPKFVVTSTDLALEWNNSIALRGDVVDDVSALKEKSGKDILVYGGARLVNTLLSSNLIDDLRVWFHPVML